MKTIEDVNAMKSAEFEKTFGDVAEHSPWVARNAAGDRPFAIAGSHDPGLSRGGSLPHRKRRNWRLIRAHPDLATQGKAHG